MANSPPDIDSVTLNEQRLKSLRNGETIEVKNQDLCRLLKYIELTLPDFSFSFKINHKTKGFTTLKMQNHG